MNNEKEEEGKGNKNKPRRIVYEQSSVVEKEIGPTIQE
jgi:hypothetical protein